MGSENYDYKQMALKLGEVFRPTTAIEQADLFCGRLSQIRMVVDAINQTGRHAILYGEPGVGKTSLAKILATQIKSKRHVISPHINCDSGDDYDSLWRKVFDEIEIVAEVPVMGLLTQSTEVSQSLGETIEGKVTPDAVRKALTKIGQDNLLYVILDEFDKIPSLGVRNLVADTVKVLSDRAVPVTLILVGVADDITGLIADHQSVERCLAQIPMPRMRREELEEIVTKGLTTVQMNIEANALNEITGLSKGLPHYTHLLALHAGRRALDCESRLVTQRHVKDAIQTAVQETQQSIRTVYDKATYSTKKTAIYKHVLLACAMTDQDEFGNFQPATVGEPLTRIRKRKYTTEAFARHLHAFCEQERGPVLRKTGVEYRWRYRFSNPLMQPYVLMKGLADGMIEETELGLQYDSSGQERMAFND